MESTTYDSLLKTLQEARYAQYRSDPDRDAARLEAIEYVLHELLAKLDDRERAAAVMGSHTTGE